MISVDSFEDLTSRANAISVRRFSPVTVNIPLQIRHCSVEGGDEVPTLGVGNGIQIWWDRTKNEPASRIDPNVSSKMMNVTTLAQIPTS